MAPKRTSSVVVALSPSEVELLVTLAHYYEKRMGPMRFVVAALSGPEMRRRFRFVSEEGKWLERFARATQEAYGESSADAMNVSFTPRSAVAYWGRLLATLNTPRVRRRLSPTEIARREHLEGKLAGAVLRLYGKHREEIEEEVGMRRVPEQTWMRERLTARGD